MLRRITVVFIVVLSVFFVPWWISLALAIAASFYFKNFFEIVLVGLIIDSIYGSMVSGLSFAYFFTIITAVLFLFVEFLKQRLIMY